MEAAAWGFIGTLVGAIASLAGTWLTNRHSQALHSLERKLIREERQRVFQRDTLIALQDALHDLLRHTARGHHEDTVAFHEGKKWGENQLSGVVDDGLMVGRRHMLILLERVSDDELRTEVKNLNTLLTDVNMARTMETADHLLGIATTQGIETLEKIGAVLRAQY